MQNEGQNEHVVEALVQNEHVVEALVQTDHVDEALVQSDHVDDVRCIYLYIVFSLYVRGFTAYLHLYLYYILWPLAPRGIQVAYS